MKAAHDLSQLLLLRLDENRWTASLGRLLCDLSPGGVFLSSPLPCSPAATNELLRQIGCTLPVPPFLALQEEGGAEDPLSRFFPRLPSPRAAAEKGLSAVACLGGSIGEALRLLGFNCNLAPSLDLPSPFGENTLAGSSFGSDPQRVAECGGAFLRGLERTRILACGKHFPGWGSVSVETPQGLPVSGKPMAALWREDLLPYRELLPRLPMVLISAGVYKAYDFDQPRAASLSAQVVQGLLRTKLNYRGLALACHLESEEVRGALGLGDAAIQSLDSGCDMLLVSQKALVEVVPALEAGLASGRLSSQRTEEALERVRAAKKKMAPPAGQPSRGALARLIRRFENFSREFRPEELNLA